MRQLSNTKSPKIANPQSRCKFCAGLFAIILTPSLTVSAADRTWDGGSASGANWSSSDVFIIFTYTGANWNTTLAMSGAPVDGDSLFFDGSTRTTNNNNLAADTSFAGLTFNSGAAAFTLNGNRISLAGNVTNNSASLQTINLALALPATRTFNAASGNIAVAGVISGPGGLTKTGSNVLTLSAANTYTGLTTVSAGRLVVSSGNINSTSGVSISGGEFHYNSATVLSKTVSFSGTGGALSGSGTITNAVAVTSGNTYSAGAVGDPGTQTFSSALSFASGSIFSWDLDASATNPVSGTNQGSYDKVIANGAVSGTSIFNIVLGSNSFTDAFWNSNKSWNDIFSGSGSKNLAALFTTFSGAGVSSTGLVSGQGQFSFSGNTLNWAAVPEPSAALSGLLLGAGLLRRRR